MQTVINGLTFDGAVADPMRRAVQDVLLSFPAALGQAQAEATKEAQKAGVAHAKATGENALSRAQATLLPRAGGGPAR